MIAKRIIPCLDVKNGETVKGTNFINLRSAGDPVALGKAYSDAGADELVFLDITASHEGRKTFTDMVTRVAQELNIPFTVGGGINTVEDVERLLSAGADKISINSAALRRPELINEITERFGSQVCVVAIDAKQESDGTLSAVANESVIAKMSHQLPEKPAVMTDTVKKLDDGWQFAGDEYELVHTVLVSELDSVERAENVVLDGFGKADAALAASVFHFGEISIAELKKYLKDENINVRI